jgi:folylpolyglutamate synthase
MRGIWTSIRWQSFPRRGVSTHSATMTRTYENAIAALNSLQTNYAIVEQLRKSKSPADQNARSLPETVEWLRRIGYTVRHYRDIQLRRSLGLIQASF